MNRLLNGRYALLALFPISSDRRVPAQSIQRKLYADELQMIKAYTQKYSVELDVNEIRDTEFLIDDSLDKEVSLKYVW